MADVRPFAALRPTPELAEQVASPPYDVIDSAEARAMAADNPHSFLHVTKPEIDLPEGTDLYSDEVYAKGRENLQGLIAEGTLFREDAPCFYVYRQQMGDHVQTGVVAGASIAEYDAGKIKKHEFTRPDKEDDRTRHILALRANTGPVFLTYPQSDEIDAIVAGVCDLDPTYDFVADDGIAHTLWVVDDNSTNAAIAMAFDQIDALYIADGHHRSAAASRACKELHDDSEQTAEAPHHFFLSVIFPDDQMLILDYNRVVHDLNGLDKSTFMERVSESFDIEPSSETKPTEARTFQMYIDGEWYKLSANAGIVPEDDPVNRLDVAILQNHVLGPILGVDDPRTSKRIDFVGGIRGTSELARHVDGGAAVAVAMYPTSMAELMAIADAGEVMPPKSTWFEPKLRSGLIVKAL